ncbi:MAG: hypothetical protein RL030_2425, partial [Pseudomonadota bacterium]
TGSYEDARRLAEWDFLRKTPEQRLQWLISMLEIRHIPPPDPGSDLPGNETR